MTKFVSPSNNRWTVGITPFRERWCPSILGGVRLLGSWPMLLVLAGCGATSSAPATNGEAKDASVRGADGSVDAPPSSDSGRNPSDGSQNSDVAADVSVDSGMGQNQDAAADVRVDSGMGQNQDASRPPTAPNFLFIIADDQRWDALGVVQREQGAQGRFPWFKNGTPNEDRIAAEGVRFTNAFATSSLCSPSRAVFLTGEYTHLNGVANNVTVFPLNNVTHATLMKQNGYVTGYFGKWHMGSQTARPGFTEYASFIGQGQYFGDTYEVSTNGGAPQQVTEPATTWVDDSTATFAIDFITRHKNDKFSMVVGLKSPHEPWTAPTNLYAGDNALPAVNQNSLPSWTNPAMNVPVATTIEAYFSVITYADADVGRILSALDSLNLTDKTVIVFTSDQGYHLGEHDRMDKRTAYEESMRIPLLIRYPPLIAPSNGGGVIAAEVLNIDLAPTFLDLAGVAIPPTMQGKSWVPLLQNPTSSLRSSVFYEYFWENIPSNEFGWDVPAIVAIRTGNGKLVSYPNHPAWLQLFDLKADPFETTNQANNPNYATLQSTLQNDLNTSKTNFAYVYPSYADRPADGGLPP